MTPLAFSYSYDYKYNEQKWIEDIQTKVKSHIPSPKANIGIIGHHKDDSSYYLDSFPQWNIIEMENTELLNATDIRDLYFTNEIAPINIVNDLSMNFYKEALIWFRDHSEELSSKLKEILIKKS